MVKILVAAPTHECKEYAMERWLNAVNALTVPHDTLLADNSPDENYVTRWCSRVPMIHLHFPPQATKHRRIADSMEHIRRFFVRGNWDFWLDVETDVIVPPETAVFMLANLGNSDRLNLPYPYHHGRKIETGFGCTLFTKNMMEQESFAEAPSDYSTDAWFWDKTYPRWKSVYLHDSALRIQHLSDAK